MPWLAVILSEPRGESWMFLSASSACGQPRQNFAHRAVEQLAFVGEGEAAGMALEQRRRDFLFQRADLPAHRRLAQGEHLAGMGEASRRCDGMKDAKLVPIHFNPSKPLGPENGDAANQ